MTSIFSFIVKQFLDSVFVMSRIIKVSVRVTETLIILNITKTSSNNNCVLLILFLQLHTVVLYCRWKFPSIATWWLVVIKLVLVAEINLSIKTESARSSSNKWTKTLYWDYLHCIANLSRALLNIFSKQVISSNTKRRKWMLNFLWNTWKYYIGEMKLIIIMKFCQCFHKISGH